MTFTFLQKSPSQHLNTVYILKTENSKIEDSDHIHKQKTKQHQKSPEGHSWLEDYQILLHIFQHVKSSEYPCVLYLSHSGQTCSVCLALMNPCILTGFSAANHCQLNSSSSRHLSDHFNCKSDCIILTFSTCFPVCRMKSSLRSAYLDLSIQLLCLFSERLIHPYHSSITILNPGNAQGELLSHPLIPILHQAITL